MEDYNLVPRAKKCLEISLDLANKYKHTKANCAHLFSALIQNATLPVKNILSKFNLNFDNLVKALMLEFPQSNPSYFNQKSQDWWHKDIEITMKKAFDLSQKFQHNFIGIEHLIYVILTSDNKTKDFLLEKGVPCKEVSEIVIAILDPSSEEEKPETKSGKQEATKEKFISKYCHNLNELVLKLNSKIEGRDEEIDKLTEILSCKIKNNAILLGDAGVGKTAIVEGFAQRINSLNVPVFLSSSVVYSLDLGLMLAGTKYRGQFEERLKGLLEELKENPNTILFIDEIHSIVGAGSNEGSADLANMLKPALARGEIKCIGATTTAEYKKYFEKDSALNRRFQSINVEEPDKEKTFNIIKRAKGNYEEFHGVTYTDLTIKNIINLSDKYLPYRKFPDKAFDILDRIGANGKIKKFKLPDRIKKLEMDLMECMQELPTSNEEIDIKIKNKCEKMLDKFLKKRNEWLKETANEILNVDETHIKEVISSISGIKYEKIELDTCSSILSLKEDLKSKIFDQSEVIDKIYDILLCSKAEIKKRNKTLANLLFVGSTGVGKTYTAKIIAEKFFNKPNSFLQVDMGEYVEKNSMSKLLGATAGYVGYEEGGLLSEFVRANPSSLILFDEVEKAHPDMMNMLLRIMDEGSLIDNFNRKIDFSNTIIVLTGNVGAEVETARSMGFSVVSSEAIRHSEYDKIIKQQFKPELLSRLDEVLIFNNKFSEEGILKMIEESLQEVKDSLLKKNILLRNSNELKVHLYQCIKNDGNNARTVQKVLRSKFELPLCKIVVSSEKISEISTKIIDNDISFCTI